MFQKFFSGRNRYVAWLGGWLLGASALAQAPTSEPVALPLNDLSAFRSPVQANWRVVADVMADPYQPSGLTTQPGTGVLANVPARAGQYGEQYDLYTNLQHGDLDLEFDYLMAKGSNSGVYLQGRYEIQLFDSWGQRSAWAGGNGGIYERWDESRGPGKQGYEGHAPRQNASRAPGLWQRLRISFQAPRFDAQGRKIENARFLRVELNGVLIHENVELSGPTRGGAAEEVARGPLRFQGDHGAVALRNIRYVSYDKPRPELLGLTYKVYKGKFEKEPDYKKLPPEAEGPTSELTPAVSKLSNEFLIRYIGTLRVKEPGRYRFNLGVPGGGGVLRINNQPVLARAEWNGAETVTLPAGDLPFELAYAKMVDWVKPGLGLAVSGPGVREFLLTSAEPGGDETDPILVTAERNIILRSFMDLPGITTPDADKRNLSNRSRVVHAVSVGSPAQVHYTYDMDHGNVVQIWRGQFLDATPMWNDRGDGSSRPMGMTQQFGHPALFLTRGNVATWPTDTTGSSYRPRGYVLDEVDQPTFRYDVHGARVSDALRVLPDATGLERSVSVEGAPSGLTARLAEGGRIEQMPNGLFSVDKTYYVRAEGATIRSVGSRQELVMPVAKAITYSILF